jgi:hypothetical protein
VDPSESTAGEMTNGAAMAAYLGAAIGAFAMGLVVMLSEAGIFTAPSLYALIAWGALHRRWKNRHVEARRSWLLALVLIGLGVLFAFPPFWGVIP